MSELAIRDCLVLKLEERDAVSQEIDTTVYIFYDKKEHNYVIRGQRKWTPTYQSGAYSFVTERADDLVDFLQYVISKNNTVDEVLYNYDNFPTESAEITFEFLSQYDHADYELSGYNNKKLGRKRLLKNLRMLRNVFNYCK